MKRALKIVGWTLFGVVMMVVILALVAIYIVFTPAHLTPIARQAADRFITTEYEIGEVELTFFSTFPRFGLRADGLLLVNPKAGAPNDTVVKASHLTAIVDVREFLVNRNLHVSEAILDEAQVHFYMAPDGTTNLSDVFLTSPDTTTDDTTAFSLPFNELRVDKLRLQTDAISFVNAKDTIEASLGATELWAEANSWQDLFVSLDANAVCATVKGNVFADSLRLQLEAPLAVNLDSMHFAFRRARLDVNDFALTLGGEVQLGDSMYVDAGLTTDPWHIRPLLSLVPATFTSSLTDLDLDGIIQLSATAKGFVSDSQMPLITAHVDLTDGEGSYKPIPYKLRDLTLNADAELNLNEGQQSNAVVHKLHAATRNSQLSIINSQLSDLLGDMLLDLQLTLDANLPDFAYFLPKQMTLDGRTKGTAKVKIRLSDLTKMRLERGSIYADLQLQNIHYAMDSMLADLPQTHARIRLPNPKPSKSQVNWARIDLDTKLVDFAMGNTISAQIASPVISAEVANVLANQQDYFASIQLNGLHALYDTIQADLQASQMEVFVNGGKRVSAKLNTAALNAQMGESMQAKTGALALEAAARYNPEGENVLLQWNPRLKINLKSGRLSLPDRLPEPVYIPSIEFKYSNREMTIDNSRIELGHSDLNLQGKVRHIGKWLRKEAVLEGELSIISDHCDANQLMSWFSADNGSEEKNPTAEGGSTASESERSNSASGPTGEAEPFLVPTNVDLALNTHIREVEIFNQVAKDLKGGLYVKNGTLILDEMGFVCRAAKLQLTAMYRTPRRNHLYLGLDYHMLDVDIDELLSMIPDLEQMMPMLSSFKGAAEFHLAAETYLTSQYKPKMSTLRGAASLTGKDLVVMDGETFSQISKLLLFNKKTENRIDSLNAEITIYKNEIDVYPLCVQMDNYMVALGGRHNTNMSFNYDINVLSPIYLGVNVSGTIDDLKIKLAKCKFAQDFRPRWFDKVDTQSLELRQRIKQSMEKNVRIQK